MKHLKTLSILALSSVLLMTGCSKKLSEDKFKEVLQSVTDTVNAGTEVTNVHIKDNAQYTYDYKEGEFFRYHSFALLILVPVTDTVCTWEEDGKYYHYVNNTLTKKTEDVEISKDDFDKYMAEHKKTIQEALLRTVDAAKTLIAADPVTYISVENKFSYATFEKTYKMSSKNTKEVEVTEGSETKKEIREETNNIEFKNNLPKEWIIKNDGKKTWKYTYGDAKFTNPHNTNTSENQ